MNSSYVAQESKLDELSNLTKSKRFWGRAACVSVIAIVIPPLLAVVGTIVGMMRTFEEIGQTGEVNQEAVAGNISTSLLTTMAGLLVSCIALVVFVVAIILYFKRRQSLRTLVEEIPAQKALG